MKYSPETLQPLIMGPLARHLKRFANPICETAQYSALFNAGGSKKPIVWVFNSWVEAILLARKLGDDYPLLAFASLQDGIKDYASKLLARDVIIEHYFEEMVARLGGAPAIIAGNCQAAPFAESMAHMSVSKLGVAPNMVLMEQRSHYYYPGNVLLLFGEQSEGFNPFLKGADPAGDWQRRYGNYAHAIIPGDHGKYFIGPGLAQLTDSLKAFHASAETADA